MSTPMTVHVTITKDGATYESNNPAVESDGTINIEDGEKADITFEPAAGEPWSFQDPWIVITGPPGGNDVTLISGTASAVEIEDNNSAAPASMYEYCLQTTDGALDPRIINKGT